MLLRVRRNAQITLPARVRKAANLEDGDILDCEVEHGRIVLTPKRLIDKRDAWFWSPEWQQAEAEAEENIRADEVNEYGGVDELVKHLNEE